MRFSAPEFARLLNELKSERDALDSAWKSLAKQRGALRPSADADQKHLEILLKQTLVRLQQERKNPPPTPSAEKVPSQKQQGPHDHAGPATKPIAGGSKSEAPVPENQLPGKIDPAYLGHALMRAEKYAEALAAFRQVDLKGKKVEERAPIQLLMANCLLHLGKNEEALDLLREAANAHSNERVAGYAQWHLELHRWQRDINDRLQDVRKRRLALENAP